MASPDLDALYAKIDQAVNPLGQLPKTTGPGLNSLLRTLAKELSDSPDGPGSAAAASLTVLPHAELLARQQAGTLVPGAFYQATQRPTTTLGSTGDVLVQAASADALAPEALLSARVPDYSVPLWRSNYYEVGAATGTTYTQEDVPFKTITPDPTDYVDMSLDGDDNVVPAQLPFTFQYGGRSYDKVMVDSNARVVLDPDPAYAKSEYDQHPLAPGYAAIFLCWGDLYVNPGTVRYFVTGQAPYRKFVADYTNVIPQTHYGAFYFSGLCSGQIVLEETTNVVALGFSANSLTETNWVQGLQYPEQAYQLYKDQVLPAGVWHRFTPVTARAAVVPALATTGPVRWRGRTWALAAGGNAADEPGTSAAWTPVATDDADAFGNAVPQYDAIEYSLASDAISQRRDGQGNCLRNSSLAGFPWGNPAVRNNELRDVTLDDSLLLASNLVMSGNCLHQVALRNVALAGVAFTDNELRDLTLADYAPVAFRQVEAAHGFDTVLTTCVAQRFWQKRLVQEAGPVATELLHNALHSQSQLRAAVYKNGQLISARSPDFTHPVGSIIPPHDRIDLLGDWRGQTLWLRNFDFTINGNNVYADHVAIGRGSTGMKIDISNLVTGGIDMGATSPLYSSLNLNPNAAPLAGMDVTLTRCTIGQLDPATNGSPAGTSPSRFAINHCLIGRIGRIQTSAITQHRFSHCVFGLGQTAGSILGGGSPETAASLVIANSVIHLLGTATLYDNNTPPGTLPTFQNVTLVAADGTVSRLDNQGTALSQAASASLAGLEVVAVANFNGHLGASGFNTLTMSGPVLDVRPSGTPGGWDQPNNTYVAPLSGTYEVLAKARIDDASGPVGGNYALGAGPSNVDGPWVSWNTIAPTTATNRKGHQNTRIVHLAAGDAVRLYLYLDGFEANVGGELSIKLLRRD